MEFFFLFMPSALPDLAGDSRDDLDDELLGEEELVGSRLQASFEPFVVETVCVSSDTIPASS